MRWVGRGGFPKGEVTRDTQRQTLGEATQTRRFTLWSRCEPCGSGKTDNPVVPKPEHDIDRSRCVEFLQREVGPMRHLISKERFDEIGVDVELFFMEGHGLIVPNEARVTARRYRWL